MSDDGQMQMQKSGKEKKPNAWIEHVRVFRKDHPELTYKECLVQAKKTYWAKSTAQSTA